MGLFYAGVNFLTNFQNFLENFTTEWLMLRELIGRFDQVNRAKVAIEQRVVAR